VLKLNKNEKVFIYRIDIQAVVGKGVMVVSKEAIFKYVTKDILTHIPDNYGTDRPIQFVKPKKITDKYNCSVFVDMLKENKNNDDKFYMELGLLYFDNENNISLEAVFNKIKTLANWSKAKSYAWDCYW
jgi:hypothetical protein